jgi:voltage-gated potassium channel
MLVYTIRRLLASLFTKASVGTVFALTAVYAALTYLLMRAAGESDIVAPENFFYWLVVTASTVGYGDFSPVTRAGKLTVALWVIPLGLSLFAMVLTRAGVAISDIIQRGRKGLHMIELENHTAIVGWNGSRTLRLLELLLSKANGETGPVVLCVDADIENPMPDRIEFVRVESYSHDESMKRASLDRASRIIIDNPDDNVTLTTALYCDKVSPHTHITAYFHDESVGELLRTHCGTNIECIPSVAVEMLAKSSLDPGSALLHRQLLDSTQGMTQYSAIYQGDQPIPFGELFTHFKTQLGATLIGIRPEGEQKIKINPGLDEQISKGTTVYYIAAQRLDQGYCFDLPSTSGD